MFPEGFDPAAVGLTYAPTRAGDFNADDHLGVIDISMLTPKCRRPPPLTTPYYWWLPDAMFDLNGDTVLDSEDRRVWVKDLAYTWYGDANLDGEFNSSDFVQVFTAGRYG